MVITPKVLSRRTVLRGLGATIALPFLDSMVPARSAVARAQSVAPRRFTVMYVAHGYSPGYWLPETDGPDYELTAPLQPLATFRDRMLLLSGIDNDVALQRPEDPRGGHGRMVPGFMCGVHAKPHAGRRLRGRRLDRPDRRGSPRPRHGAAVAPAHAGADRLRGHVRQRLQLRLHEHAELAIAHAAPPDAGQPPGGVRAAVRRLGQHRPGRAGPAAARAAQHPGLGPRQDTRPERKARCGRPSPLRPVPAVDSGRGAAHGARRGAEWTGSCPSWSSRCRRRTRSPSTPA